MLKDLKVFIERIFIIFSCYDTVQFEIIIDR